MKPHVVMISGKQGSGKTSLAELLSKLLFAMGMRSIRYKFADPLYEFHEYILNRMEDMTGKKRVSKDGDLLQVLGTEWGRKCKGENIWVDTLKGRIDKVKYGNAVIIVDDCRFENEFDAFPEALRVRLECPEKIRKQRNSVTPGQTWRSKTKHPSEVGLDEYALQEKFDMVFHTNEPQNTVAHIATMIHAQLTKNTWKEKRNGKK